MIPQPNSKHYLVRILSLLLVIIVSGKGFALPSGRSISNPAIDSDAALRVSAPAAEFYDQTPGKTALGSSLHLPGNPNGSTLAHAGNPTEKTGSDTPDQDSLLLLKPGMGPNGTVYLLHVQADKKVIVIGNFTKYNGITRYGIARLMPDGNLDMSFNPGSGPKSPDMPYWTTEKGSGRVLNSTQAASQLSLVKAITQQPDGKILIGGSFNSYNGIYCQGLARLNTDGTFDASFDTGLANKNQNLPATGYTVEAIAVQHDKKVILAGNFTHYNGQPCNGMARLHPDGTLDESFVSYFTLPTPADERFKITSVAVQKDGKILVGGRFSDYNGEACNGLVRLYANGDLDGNFYPALSEIDASDKEYGISSIVALPFGKILIGGKFKTNQNSNYSNVACLYSDGALIPEFQLGSASLTTVRSGKIPAAITSLALTRYGSILIGGDFSEFNEEPCNGVARLHPDGTLDKTFTIGQGVTGKIAAVASPSAGQVYLAGQFSSFNGFHSNNIVKLNNNGSPDISYNSGTGVNGSVKAVAVQPDGKLVKVGWFSSYNGVSTNCIARLRTDGNIDPGFNSGLGLDGPAFTVSVQPDGKILIGGKFTSYDGTDRKCLARINPDGSLDKSFIPGLDIHGSVYGIALQPDGKILAAGDFYSHPAKKFNGIVRLNADGSIDPEFKPGPGADLAVYSVALQADGKIILGGSFTYVNKKKSIGIARLNADGSPDKKFKSGAGITNSVWASDIGSVYSLAIQPDGKLLIAGEFNKYRGKPRNCIARLNPNGKLDETFDPGVGVGKAFDNESQGNITAIAVLPDGRIMIGGDFSTYNQTECVRIARLRPDGSHDTEFATGSGTNSSIEALAVQNDGKVIIGGCFNNCNGNKLNSIARLKSDGNPDVSFRSVHSAE